MQVQCPLLMCLKSENSMKTIIKIIPSHPPPTIIMIINMDTDDDTHLWLEEITNLDAPLLSLAYPDAVVDDTDGDSISLGDDLSGDSSDDEDTLPDLDERYTITHVNLGIVSYIEALIISELGHKHFFKSPGRNTTRRVQDFAMPVAERYFERRIIQVLPDEVVAPAADITYHYRSPLLSTNTTHFHFDNPNSKSLHNHFIKQGVVMRLADTKCSPLGIEHFYDNSYTDLFGPLAPSPISFPLSYFRNLSYYSRVNAGTVNVGKGTNDGKLRYPFMDKTRVTSTERRYHTYLILYYLYIWEEYKKTMIGTVAGPYELSIHYRKRK